MNPLDTAVAGVACKFPGARNVIKTHSAGLAKINLSEIKGLWVGFEQMVVANPGVATKANYCLPSLGGFEEAL